MENEELISVVIPLYNKESTIERTLDSLQAQTYTTWEALVVDDGSSDGGPARVERYVDERIRLLRKTNGGVSAARNFGVRHARGAYVLFLDADDCLFPVCLGELLALIREYGVGVAAANLRIDYGDGRSSVFSVYPHRGVVPCPVRALFLKEVVLRSGSFLLRTEVARRYPYDETLWRYEDYEQQLAMLRREPVAYSPVPVMTYMLDNPGLSVQDSRFDKDFTSRLPQQADSFWEGMLYGYLLDEGMRFYPRRAGWLATQYAAYRKYIRLGHILRPVFRWRHSWLKRRYRRLFGQYL